MPITIATPINVPALPARVADALWLTSLNIMAPTPAMKARVTAVLVPFVSSTGEVLPDKAKTLILDDVLTLAANDPQLGATMQAIFAEIDRQAKLAKLFG
jgi:hypothetical protein